MSGQHPPVTAGQVEKMLEAKGFVMRPQKGTSHRQWVLNDETGFYKVTVDQGKSPFGPKSDLIKFMARQAGMTRKEFYQAILDCN